MDFRLTLVSELSEGRPRLPPCPCTPGAMPPRKRAKSSAPVTEVSTLWTCDSDHSVKAVAPDGDGNVFVATDTCIYKLSGGEATVVAGGDEEEYVDGPNGKFNDISKR